MKHPMALTAIGACLVSVAALGAGLGGWHEVIQPSFVFPALGAIGSVILGIYSPKPGRS